MSRETEFKFFGDVQRISAQRPLVLNITNYVVMNWNANCLLSVGASPIMAHAFEEMEDMVSICQALVLNIGTLSSPWIESMVQAAELASRLKKPIVLDPVGVGASSFRKESIQRILSAAKPSVIRGNASEILSLAHGAASGKGVDSSDSTDAAIQAAVSLSQVLGVVVCVSGPVDFVVDGEQVRSVHSGHPLMAQVTGMGCAATAMIGAFLAVQSSKVEAVFNAMSLMGQAGERAALQASGPGSFQTSFLDELYLISQQASSQRVRHEASV